MITLLKNFLLLILFKDGFLCFCLEVTKVILDNPDVCKKAPSDKMYWASELKAIVVIGRGSDHRQAFHDCNIIVGAATTQSSILRLSFEAFHISDCGVMLTVNQSLHSSFEPDNSVLARITCDHGKVAVLHSEEKHFVQIGVHKTDAKILEYNFRINITVTDKMPENGPALHVVIIVGCVMVGVVSVSLWLLVKYLMQRSQRWREISTERNMERAIHLYNSQPLLQEPDYMYTALPVHQITARTGGNSSPPHHYRNGHAPHHNKKEVHARSRPKRSGDISFVHADGRIDTFRMQGSPEMHSCESESNLSVADRSRRTASPHDEMAVDDVNDGLPNAVDMIGDCPPSYEEALHMPTLQGLHLPHYVNMNSREDGSHET